ALRPPFAKLAGPHRRSTARCSPDAPGAPAAFRGGDGRGLGSASEEIAATASHADFAVEAADYADLFRTAISGPAVRRPPRSGVRLRIYGPLEARLQSADRMVLGALIEGTWPPEIVSDPWLSRPIRHALVLDLLGRRCSLSDHDFAQALGASEVILAYPTKLAGTPTVPSRFVP